MNYLNMHTNACMIYIYIYIYIYICACMNLSFRIGMKSLLVLDLCSSIISDLLDGARPMNSDGWAQVSIQKSNLLGC
jgi:hypothetical protein